MNQELKKALQHDIAVLNGLLDQVKIKSREVLPIRLDVQILMHIFGFKIILEDKVNTPNLYLNLEDVGCCIFEGTTGNFYLGMDNYWPIRTGPKIKVEYVHELVQLLHLLGHKIKPLTD